MLREKCREGARECWGCNFKKAGQRWLPRWGDFQQSLESSEEVPICLARGKVFQAEGTADAANHKAGGGKEASYQTLAYSHLLNHRIMPALPSGGNLGLLAGTCGLLWSSLCDAVLKGCGQTPEHPPAGWLAEQDPPTLQAHISSSLSSLSRFLSCTGGIKRVSIMNLQQDFEES